MLATIFWTPGMKQQKRPTQMRRQIQRQNILRYKATEQLAPKMDLQRQQQRQNQRQKGDTQTQTQKQTQNVLRHEAAEQLAIVMEDLWPAIQHFPRWPNPHVLFQTPTDFYSI